MSVASLYYPYYEIPAEMSAAVFTVAALRAKFAPGGLGLFYGNLSDRPLAECLFFRGQSIGVVDDFTGASWGSYVVVRTGTEDRALVAKMSSWEVDPHRAALDFDHRVLKANWQREFVLPFDAAAWSK